jgi:hypothetical protein
VFGELPTGLCVDEASGLLNDIVGLDRASARRLHVLELLGLAFERVNNRQQAPPFRPGSRDRSRPPSMVEARARRQQGVSGNWRACSPTAERPPGGRAWRERLRRERPPANRGPFGVLRKALERTTGFEPATSTLARWRSSQLSYVRMWSCVRKRNTPRGEFSVRDTGIEPVTSSVSGKRATAAPIAPVKAVRPSQLPGPLHSRLQAYLMRGGDGIRTRVYGFAGRCLASRPPHRDLKR